MEKNKEGENELPAKSIKDNIAFFQNLGKQKTTLEELAKGNLNQPTKSVKELASIFSKKPASAVPGIVKAAQVNEKRNQMVLEQFES